MKLTKLIIMVMMMIIIIILIITWISTDSDYCAFAPKMFGKLPKNTISRNYKFENKRLVSCAKELECKMCHYEVRRCTRGRVRISMPSFPTFNLKDSKWQASFAQTKLHCSLKILYCMYVLHTTLQRPRCTVPCAQSSFAGRCH